MAARAGALTSQDGRFDDRMSDPTAAPVGSADPVDRRRRRMLLVAVVTIVVLGGAGTTVAYVQRADAAAAAQLAHEAVIAVQAKSFADEQRALRVQNSAAFWEQTLADRAVAVASATVTLDAARATLAGTPQAGGEVRTALAAAIDAASAAVLATPSPSVLAIGAALSPVAAPNQAAIAEQAAWQVAEDARIAAAAAQAQADAAAAAQAAAARSSRPSRSAAQAPRAAAPAPQAPEASSGVPEFSAGALGGAINSWRAEQGLPALSISRSAGLFNHASAMASANDIWHSGGDKIVGYAQPASAGSLVQAWANSPGHRSWMANTSVSSMQVGAAVLNNTLYGAVNFS